MRVVVGEPSGSGTFAQLKEPDVPLPATITWSVPEARLPHVVGTKR